MPDFMGRDRFVWWFGVVEDIDDPLKIGRVRVRAFGYHTDDKSKIPTKSLPWAHVLQECGSASISGIGRSPTGMLPGSHVFGFFRDGLNAQHPVVMFTVGGIPSELPDPRSGFNDPTGTYPTEKDVPDTNRLATGDEKDKTILKDKEDSLVEDVMVAWDVEEKAKWSEPTSPYAAKYPNNKVFATKSGMVEEWDDTQEKERHHTYHPSGSFEEVANGWKNDPNGTRVHKVVGNNYELIAGSDFIHIKGSATITIDGDGRLLVGNGKDGGDLNLQVEGNVNLLARKDLRGVVCGNVEMDVQGDYRETIRGNKYTKVVGNCVIETEEGKIVTNSADSTAIKTHGGSDVFLEGEGRMVKLNSLSRQGSSQSDPKFVPGKYPSPF
jgi:hypothetical protein